MPDSDSTGNQKLRKGYVVSDSMDKTIVVEVQRVRRHSLYDKRLRRHSRFKVHDENEVAKVGDYVEIKETRPLSKTKRWRLVRVLETGARPTLLTLEEEPLVAEGEAEEG